MTRKPATGLLLLLAGTVAFTGTVFAVDLPGWASLTLTLGEVLILCGMRQMQTSHRPAENEPPGEVNP